MGTISLKIVLTLVVAILLGLFLYYGCLIGYTAYDEYFIKLSYFRFSIECFLIGTLFLCIPEVCKDKYVCFIAITGTILSYSMAIFDTYHFWPIAHRIKELSGPYYKILERLFVVVIIFLIQSLRFGIFKHK